jgi:HindIII restriction endonuclease
MAVGLPEIVRLITTVCGDDRLSFTTRSEEIRKAVQSCSDEELLDLLDDAGVIPECFDHDSTEEKLFAKFCDYLLAASWSVLGMQADVIVERTDAADVAASVSGYRVVGDAKAFRLSRTAKNQKDFKIEALDKWRKGAEYACLVCPLYQYPSSRSQIYLQASNYNVTLFSYTHLAFMLRHKPKGVAALQSLWEVSRAIKASQDARTYWAAVDQLVCRITASRPNDWVAAVEQTKIRLARQAAEQIAFWESEKQRIERLTLKAATQALIKALKIDGKIAVIRKNLIELEESTETFE